MRKVNTEDLFDINFLSDVRLSPDGNHAAFVVSNGSIQENKYFNYIWMYSFDDGRLTKLTSSGNDKNIDWLDNENLIFPSARTEKEKEAAKKGVPVTNYYAISVNGGEAEKLFSVPLKVSKLKRISQDIYIVLAAFDNNLEDYNSMEAEEKEKYLKKVAEADSAYKIFDEIPFWQNGAGVTNKKRNRLYVFNASDSSVKPISAPLFNVTSFNLDADKNTLAYTGVEFDSMMVQDSKLWIYDLEADKQQEVVLDSIYTIGSVEFIGNKILFAGRTGEMINSYSNSVLYTISSEGGKPEVYFDGDFSIGSSVGSDCRYGGGTGSKIYNDEYHYLSARGYSGYLFKVSDGKEVKLSPDVTGGVDCFDISAGKCVYIAARNKGLLEVYELDLASGEENALTSFNSKWIEEHDISYPEHFTFKNRDSVELDGFIIKPVGFDTGKKYPAILDIHGGPKSTYGDVLFHEMQLWASEGYFVFFSNPRGSDGGGSEFANINGDRYLNWDYNDIMDFTDTVLQMCPEIDENNIGVTGGSYGGLMTNWLVGHTDRFKAAATQRSISNYVSKCLTTDIGYYHNLNQMGTDPWTDYETFWDHSPLKYANKCNTPLLFIHSDQDYRCYMADAFQMFTALKMKGCDARVCLFHGENHELSRSGKPKNRIKRLEEITSWFNKYMK